jgi:hypothetical protein
MNTKGFSTISNGVESALSAIGGLIGAESVTTGVQASDGVGTIGYEKDLNTHEIVSRTALP